MNIGDRGLDLIRAFEGFRAEPYLDAVGVPTIGYGSTYYPGGQRVRLTDPPISEPEARRLMQATLAEFEDGISAALQVDVTQSQFDALVCWAFNIGVSAAQNSTLMRKLNSGDYLGAADQFLRWNKAGGQVLRGLTRRREAERALFLEDA
jgi:GH24 family phage-related lysozyme (muramidase)